MKNIINYIVLVQALVETIQFWSKHFLVVHQPVYQIQSSDHSIVNKKNDR